MISANTLPVDWRKSSYSSNNGGACVEVSASTLPVEWFKSSYSSSNGGNCIEVGEGVTHAVPVRDSKDPDGPALVFSTDAWGSFVSAVQGDEFPAV